MSTISSVSNPPTSVTWRMQSPPGPETTLSGRKYCYFAGTGYLGLQADPAVAEAAKQAVEQFGVHTATSRNGFGTCEPVAEVERQAAQLMGTERALYLVSGYACNFAIAATLSPAVDVVLIDETAHDCLREAVRWFDQLKKSAVKFRHCDAGHLAQLLEEHVEAGWRPIVMTDGVFPMSGKLAPLEEYLTVLGDYPGAMLLVDDAHGVAAMGENGRGSLELAGVGSDRINRDLGESLPAGPRVFLSCTLSKAVGGHGGMIPGSHAFLERMRRSSGWFRGASAPAAAVAGATAKALEIVLAHPERRRQLGQNVRQMREGLRDMGLAVDDSPSPVIGLAWEGAQRIHQALLDRGFATGFSREYTGSGPHGTLRIAVFATHTKEMIDNLLAALRESMAENA